MVQDYECTTRNIRIRVRPEYLDDESEPVEARYFWAYTVEIANLGAETVQLRRRHWRITDESGQTKEVHGLGVVGEQPVLEPGDSFEYTSGAPLRTPSGLMVGAYEMIAGSGESFMVDVPAFSLDSPFARRTMN